MDVKSASTFSFDKFVEHLSPSTDSFGYLDQLNGYMEADNHKQGAFLAVDKQLGNLVLDIHHKNDVDYKSKVEQTQKILAFKEPPPRSYHDEPDGKSGNRKLGTYCSYCEFKSTCWPGLRTFGYAGRPVFLTKVERLPNVKELT